MSKLVVKKIGVVKTSLIASLVLFFVSLIFLVPMALFMSLMGGGSIPGFGLSGLALVIVMPFIYAVVGFLMTAISCLLYNAIAKATGGAEFEVDISEVDLIQ